MSTYQTPISISQVIKDLKADKYVLPAIQREFVWKEEQIENLFDSIMRGYPIGTFLFWELEDQTQKEYIFYRFIRDYNALTGGHNEQLSLRDKSLQTQIAVLDGQQRLTALFIGLCGSITKLKPYTKTGITTTKYLCLNLIPNDDYESERENKYHFKFLEDFEIQISHDECLWYKVRDILDTKPHKLSDFVLKQTSKHNYSESVKEEINESIFLLNEAININPMISYFTEKDQSLDRVLDIFVKVNSGGTKLSYSDLLLSVATAQWSNSNAREEIHALVDELNESNIFSFSKDWVMKACLVLSDIEDIKFKGQNFTKANLELIENKWDTIRRILRCTINLIKSFGYDGKKLASNNVIIPIAYFFLRKYEKELPYLETRFMNTSNSNASAEKRNILEWLNKSVLNNAFAASTDATLKTLRNIIKLNVSSMNDQFPIEAIAKELKGKRGSITFSNDDLERLSENKYKDSQTYSLLCLIYGHHNVQKGCHVDHLYPRQLFNSRKKLEALDPTNPERILDLSESIYNLAILNPQHNQEKGDSLLQDFLSEQNADDKDNFIKIHRIPYLDFYDLDGFENFIFLRKEILKARLASVLGIRLQEEPVI
jgi:uncharacterized protein with ParB-like and HNH nuclease domain